MAFWNTADISFVGGWWSGRRKEDGERVWWKEAGDAEEGDGGRTGPGRERHMQGQRVNDKWLETIPRPDGMTPSLQLSAMEYPRIIPSNVSKRKVFQKKTKKSCRYGVAQSRPLMTLPTEEILKKHMTHISSWFRVPAKQQTRVEPMKVNNPPWNDRHSVCDSKDNSIRHAHFRSYFSKPIDPIVNEEMPKMTLVDTFLSTAPHSLFDCSLMDTYPEGPSPLSASYEDFSQDGFDPSLTSTLRLESTDFSGEAVEDKSPYQGRSSRSPLDDASPFCHEPEGVDTVPPRQPKASSSRLLEKARPEPARESVLLKRVLSRQSDHEHLLKGTFLSADNAGVEQFEKFFNWARNKYGSLVRCWAHIDRDGNMILTRSEFFKHLVDEGYNASELKDLWALFDRDHSNSVSFHHFDPETALHLATFKHWAIQEFGSIEKLCKACDDNNNGMLTLEEFTIGCENHGLASTHTVRCLFQMCGATKKISEKSHLKLDRILFLDKWDCEEHLYAQPDYKGKDILKKALLRQHKNNALAAWRKDIDKDGSMRVNYLEFAKACKKIQRQVSAEFDIGGVWRAFDSNLSGWLSLREFDEQSHQELSKFKAWVCSNYENSSKFVKQVGTKESRVGLHDTYALSKQKFRAIIHKAGLFDIGSRFSVQGAIDGASKMVAQEMLNTEEAKAIGNFFDALDVHNSGSLTTASVRFLDHWDIEKEHAEEVAWSKLVQTRQELKTQFVRNSMTHRPSDIAPSLKMLSCDDVDPHTTKQGPPEQGSLI